MKSSAVIFTALFALLNIPTLFAQSSDVTIHIKGFRNDSGQCIVYIHSKKEGFPHKHDIEIPFPINDKECIATIHLPKDGRYAITVLHDENSNNKMESNFIGIPKEGYGAANDAKGRFGPPKFEDASFVYDGKPLNLNIKMNY